MKEVIFPLIMMCLGGLCVWLGFHIEVLKRKIYENAMRNNDLVCVLIVTFFLMGLLIGLGLGISL